MVRPAAYIEHSRISHHVSFVFFPLFDFNRASIATRSTFHAKLYPPLAKSRNMPDSSRNVSPPTITLTAPIDSSQAVTKQEVPWRYMACLSVPNASQQTGDWQEAELWIASVHPEKHDPIDHPPSAKHTDWRRYGVMVSKQKPEEQNGESKYTFKTTRKHGDSATDMPWKYFAAKAIYTVYGEEQCEGREWSIGALTVDGMSNSLVGQSTPADAPVTLPSNLFLTLGHGSDTTRDLTRLAPFEAGDPFHSLFQQARSALPEREARGSRAVSQSRSKPQQPTRSWSARSRKSSTGGVARPGSRSPSGDRNQERSYSPYGNFWSRPSSPSPTPRRY